MHKYSLSGVLFQTGVAGDSQTVDDEVTTDHIFTDELIEDDRWLKRR